LLGWRRLRQLTPVIELPQPTPVIEVPPVQADAAEV
jgi:hypothetical protein